MVVYENVKITFHASEIRILGFLKSTINQENDSEIIICQPFWVFFKYVRRRRVCFVKSSYWSNVHVNIITDNSEYSSFKVRKFL